MKQLTVPNFPQFRFLSVAALEMLTNANTLLVSYGENPLFLITSGGEITILSKAVLSTNDIQNMQVATVTPGFLLRPNHSVTITFSKENGDPLEIEISYLNLET